MIKYTSEKSIEYTWFADHCLSLQTVGSKAYVDGQYIVVCKYDEVDATLIVFPENTIIAHPRTGSLSSKSYAGTVPAPIVRGGWDSTLTYFDSDYIYPILDDHKGTAVIDPKLSKVEFINYDYGNYYIVNSLDTTEIVSWKGPPAKHIPINQLSFNISGIEATDESSSFDKYIYKAGEQYLLSPKCNDYLNALTQYKNEYGLVLGCGFNNNKLLVVVAYTVSAPQGAVDMTPYGPYVALWIYNGATPDPQTKNSDNIRVDGWERLAKAKWYPYPYNTVPWSFNASGTSAVSSDGDMCTITYDSGVYTASFNITTDTSGKNTNLIIGQRIISGGNIGSGFDSIRDTSFTRQVEDKFFGYCDDDLLHMKVKVDNFSAHVTQQTSSWNDVATSTDIRSPYRPDEIRIAGDLDVLSASIFSNGASWAIEGCPVQFTWSVSGPVSFTCLNDNCWAIRLTYDDPTKCVAPNRDGTPRTVDFTATVTALGITATRYWSITSSPNGTWCHTSISQSGGPNCAPGWVDAWWDYYVTNCGSNSCEIPGNITNVGMSSITYVCTSPGCDTTYVLGYRCP